MNSFSVEQEIFIKKTPKDVFEGMTNDVSSWWDHSFTETPKAIILEPKLGGRFYEDFGNGNGVIYCTVTHFIKNKKITLQGPMGMQGAVFVNINFELDEKDGSTILKLSHQAFVEISDYKKKNYSKGWIELLEGRLKKIVETGSL